MTTSARRGRVTVIGGGLSGLIAATEAAESGAAVRVLEARPSLGGRAVSTTGPFTANLGPHALYDGTTLWDWLRHRGLTHGCKPARNPNIRFRWEGKLRRTPPPALLPGFRLGRVDAPVDTDLRTWAAERWGDETAQALAGVSGALTFDHDPGRLSAAFVVERIQRILLRPTGAARYVPGGWSTIIDRAAAHARDMGVTIDVGHPVDRRQLDDLREAGPVVVAVEPAAARRLLGGLDQGERRRVAVLDVGIRRARDPYLVLDLDEAIFWTRPSAILDGLAPDEADLIQLSVGMGVGESLDDAEGRLEQVLDAADPDWRERVLWRRRGALRDATGAVDLPGLTWRDRPSVDHSPGVWAAGDWVAAPGHLAEVGCNSAVTAARHAVAALSRRATADGPVAPAET
ncbi:NAD(P)-binding protein [Iamia sp. SCSIO 61187]|uniref:NAD(P)-binding protein n=1 Tax=Iamia sp. SCSIO 61187 TaxID=2722752 RepID=UPI001C62E72B|nr:NAD(P)-binding protein [Iamia sp. SCSIO 61187]QYG91723.1 NAD(P)-binding protein [Iamia sp. SCSIO 61187]